ncbi:MAG: DUF2127 domain-containing protein [Thermoanaerobaculia bacterium]
METSSEPSQRPKLSAGFIGIIAFKYVKGAAFLLVGIVALRIAHLTNHSEPMEIARFFGVDEGRVSVRYLASLLSAFTAGQVQAAGLAAIFVGLVFAAEGTCLLLRISWAPYLTIVLTALGIPVELVEIAKRPASGRRYLLLAVNLAILAYLWKRRNEFRTRPG